MADDGGTSKESGQPEPRSGDLTTKEGAKQLLIEVVRENPSLLTELLSGANATRKETSKGKEKGEARR